MRPLFTVYLVLAASDRREHGLLGVVDSRLQSREALRICRPENDHLVQVVRCLEIADVFPDLQKRKEKKTSACIIKLLLYTTVPGSPIGVALLHTINRELCGNT